MVPGGTLGRGQRGGGCIVDGQELEVYGDFAIVSRLGNPVDVGDVMEVPKSRTVDLRGGKVSSSRSSGKVSLSD